MGRFPKSWAGVAVGAALSLLAARAEAATYLLNYNAAWGNPFAANLTVETADVLNAVGGYDVTDITGTVDGDTITGVIVNPNQPGYSYSADGLFIIDNVLFTGAPNVSWYGLFFSGASGDEYNLFSDNATTYELYRARSGVGYLANSVGSVAVQAAPPPPPIQSESNSLQGGAVPEPTTWAMLILGFGAIGGALRRRRAVATVA